jgi:hypothetical protein
MKRKTLLPARCRQVVPQVRSFARRLFRERKAFFSAEAGKTLLLRVQRRKDSIADAATRLSDGKDFHQRLTLWNLKFESEKIRYRRDRSWRGRVDRPEWHCRTLQLLVLDDPQVQDLTRIIRSYR